VGPVSNTSIAPEIVMAHQDFKNAVDKPIDLVEAVRQYRANERASRRVAFRSAEVDGWGISSRGHAALRSREAGAQQIKLALALAGHERLAQALTDEAVARWMIRCFEVAGGPIPGMRKDATAERYYEQLFAAQRVIRGLVHHI
jgi:hypothetical protein